MGKEDGRQKDRLWQQISGVSCAPGVSQTLQKGENTGCATLSIVAPCHVHAAHGESARSRHGKLNASSEYCFPECCVLLRLWLSWKG